MNTQNYKYKVNYLHHLMAMAFVRIADDASLQSLTVRLVSVH